MIVRSPSPSERKLNDVVIYPVQDHAYIAVYWKDLPIGKGPAISLYVYNKEVFRFDCFGEGRGHYHTNLTQPSLAPSEDGRFYMSERTIKDQIERSIFELQTNTLNHLRKNFDPRVTFFKLDPVRMKNACREAKAKMLEYALK